MSKIKNDLGFESLRTAVPNLFYAPLILKNFMIFRLHTPQIHYTIYNIRNDFIADKDIVYSITGRY